MHWGDRGHRDKTHYSEFPDAPFHDTIHLELSNKSLHYKIKAHQVRCFITQLKYKFRYSIATIRDNKKYLS